MKTKKQLELENELLIKILSDVHKHSANVQDPDNSTNVNLWAACSFIKEWCEYGFDRLSDIQEEFK